LSAAQFGQDHVMVP